MDTTPGKEPVVFKSQNASKSFKVNIKILAGIFVFVFMVGGIGTGVYLTQRSQQLTSRASLDKVDLALQPSEISATASGQFQTDVVVTTNPLKAAAVEAVIKYDPEYLRLDGILLVKTFLDTELKLATESGSFILGTLDPDGKGGTGTLATLSFTALKDTSTPTAITFDPAKTRVSAAGQSTDMKGDLGQALVTIGSQTASPSPSPSSSSSPLPSPSPSPSAAVSYDFNGDSAINAVDLSIMYSGWGTPTTDTQKKADLNNDGVINGLDYSQFLPQFTP